MKITHRKSAPWYIIAQENNTLEAFNEKRAKTTEITVDLTLRIKRDPEKMAMYQGNLEVQNYSQFLRS